jgi:hypothetical protein
MKIRPLTSSGLLIVMPLFLSGCLKENSDVIDPGKEPFNFEVTESQLSYINESRGEQYEITDPVPVLHYAGEIYTIDRFEIRGDNTLNFRRKGFGLNMDRKMNKKRMKENMRNSSFWPWFTIILT